jgi:hypothetical protein
MKAFASISIVTINPSGLMNYRNRYYNPGCGASSPKILFAGDALKFPGSSLRKSKIDGEI